MEAIQRPLAARYVAWLLGQRTRIWGIWIYAAMGVALLGFGVKVLGRDIEAGVSWLIAGCVSFLVAHGLLVVRYASRTIEKLEAEKAELEAQLPNA